MTMTMMAQMPGTGSQTPQQTSKSSVWSLIDELESTQTQATKCERIERDCNENRIRETRSLWRDSGAGSMLADEAACMLVGLHDIAMHARMKHSRHSDFAGVVDLSTAIFAKSERASLVIKYDVSGRSSFGRQLGSHHLESLTISIQSPTNVPSQLRT